MLKPLTKEQFQKLFGIQILDYQLNFFNEMVKAHNEVKRLVVYPARTRTHNLIDCMNVYRALENNIKPNIIFFDEFIGG